MKRLFFLLGIVVVFLGAFLVTPVMAQDCNGRDICEPTPPENGCPIDADECPQEPYCERFPDDCVEICYFDAQTGEQIFIIDQDGIQYREGPCPEESTPSSNTEEDVFIIGCPDIFGPFLGGEYETSNVYFVGNELDLDQWDRLNSGDYTDLPYFSEVDILNQNDIVRDNVSGMLCPNGSEFAGYYIATDANGTLLVVLNIGMNDNFVWIIEVSYWNQDVFSQDPINEYWHRED